MISEKLLAARAEEFSGTGTFTSPSVSLVSSLLGGATTSGVRINEFTAEGIPAWFSCRQVVSETVGQAPLKVLRKLQRGKRIDESHPLYYVLHDQFNPEMTAYEGKELLTRNVADWGNGYAEIERDAAGRVKALWPLAPHRMRVDRDSLNRRRYRYTNALGNQFEWTWNPLKPPIFHLRANTLDGLVGRSAIRILSDCFGLTKAAEEFGARFFSNDMTPSAIATYAGKLTPQQKQNLRESWTKVHGGLSNAHRLAILENDIKLEKIGIDPNAGQFLETRGLQIEEIARVLRVPLFMIQHMTKSTSWGTGIEQVMLAFVNLTMKPWFTIWEQAVGRDLLTQRSFTTHTVRFDATALMRADFLTMQKGRQIQLMAGALNANEWRELEGYNARDDAFGDDFMVPAVNVTPVQMAAQDLIDEEDPENEQPTDADPAPPTVIAGEPDEVM